MCCLAVRRAIIVINRGADLGGVTKLVVSPEPNETAESTALGAGMLCRRTETLARRVEPCAILVLEIRPRVLAERGAAVNCIAAGIEARAHGRVVALLVSHIGSDAAGVTGRATTLHHQVDDSAGSVRPKSRGRIRDDFHAFNFAGRHLLECRGAITAQHRRWLSVDEYLNTGVTAEADLSIHVNLDGRYVLQEIAGRSGGAHDVLADIVHLAID